MKEKNSSYEKWVAYETILQNLEKAVIEKNFVSLRACCFDFLKLIAKNPPVHDGKLEPFLEKLFKFSDVSVIMKEVSNEFLLVFGMFLLCSPHISGKKRASWSKHLTKFILTFSTYSEFTLLSIVYSLLEPIDLSSAANGNRLIDNCKNGLARLSKLMESSLELSGMTNEVLSNLLNLECVIYFLRKHNTAHTVRLDLLLSLLFELSSLLRSLITRATNDEGDLFERVRANNSLRCMLRSCFRLHHDIIIIYRDALFPVADVLVSVVMEILESSFISFHSFSRRLCYEACCKLLRLNFVLSKSSHVLKLLCFIRRELFLWCKIRSQRDPTWEKLVQEDIFREERDLIHGQENWEQVEDGSSSSLLWALKLFQTYIQSTCFKMERDKNILSTRSELCQLMLMVCRKTDQCNVMEPLKSQLCRLKKVLSGNCNDKRIYFLSRMNVEADECNTVQAPKTEVEDEAGDRRIKRKISHVHKGSVNEADSDASRNQHKKTICVQRSLDISPDNLHHTRTISVQADTEDLYNRTFVSSDVEKDTERNNPPLEGTASYRDPPIGLTEKKVSEGNSVSKETEQTVQVSVEEILDGMDLSLSSQHC